MENVIALAGAVLIIVLIAVFAIPLDAWFRSVGAPNGFSMMAALTVLLGTGASPAVLLIKKISEEEY